MSDIEPDAWGRVTRVEAAEGPGVSYSYDAADRLVGARYGTAPWVTLSYDLAGRKTGMVDPDMGAWTYVYNALGSLTAQTDAAGCATEMRYDGLGRLAGKSFGSACPATAEVTYAYDGVQYLSRAQTTQLAGQKGYRSGMLDGTGYTNWTYDARGRVVSEQKTIGTRAFASDWTYNSADLVASLTYPADENGQREVVSYHYLPQKLLYSLVGEAAYVEAAQYDAAGRLTQRGLGARDAAGEPLLTQYQYAGWEADANANDDYFDSQGRLLSITSGVENTPGMLQDLSYRYDIGGNITQITDANLGPQTQVFAYDALDRITAAQAVGGSVGTYSENYTYDEEGRLHTRGGVEYFYETSHAHAVSRLSNGDQFVYDANGSMTTRVIGADTITLLYDGSLRMVAVQKNGATIAEFAYDGDGRMVVSAVGGVTTCTVGGYFELKITASGSTAVKYYSAGGTRVAMRQGDTVTYLFGDHLGSTSVTFDDAANATQSQGYTAFGEQRYSLGGDLPTDYAYTGQKEFAEIGLHFYNARWYDGALGRFTQADSIIPQPGNPMAWDRFAYVLNSPIDNSDPSGNYTCEDSMPNCDSRHTTWVNWQPIPSAEEVINIENVPFSNVKGAVKNYAKLRLFLYYKYGEKAVDRTGKITDKYFIALIISGEFGLLRNTNPSVYNEALEAVSNQYDDPASNWNNMTCEHSCTIGEQLQWASDVQGIYSGNSLKSIMSNAEQFESYLDDATLAMNHIVFGKNDSWMWGNVNESDITSTDEIEYYNDYIITAKGISFYPGYKYSIVWGWYPIQ